jgi:hypothetical protein
MITANKNTQPDGADAVDTKLVSDYEAGKDYREEYYIKVCQVDKHIKYYQEQIKKVGEEFTVKELELMAAGLGYFYRQDEQDRAHALRLKLYALVKEKSQ